MLEIQKEILIYLSGKYPEYIPLEGLYKTSKYSKDNLIETINDLAEDGYVKLNVEDITKIEPNVYSIKKTEDGCIVNLTYNTPMITYKILDKGIKYLKE